MYFWHYRTLLNDDPVVVHGAQATGRRDLKVRTVRVLRMTDGDCSSPSVGDLTESAVLAMQ